jgi:hypothetical protein
MANTPSLKASMRALSKRWKMRLGFALTRAVPR